MTGFLDGRFWFGRSRIVRMMIMLAAHGLGILQLHELLGKVQGCKLRASGFRRSGLAKASPLATQFCHSEPAKLVRNLLSVRRRCCAYLEKVLVHVPVDDPFWRAYPLLPLTSHFRLGPFHADSLKDVDQQTSQP